MENLEALRLLSVEDERNDKIHDLLETIREQIRLEIKPEHRPQSLFTNIQNAVYAFRGRTRLMNDVALTTPLLEASNLLEAAKGMKRIVEEIDGAMNHGTWRDENRRSSSRGVVTDEMVERARKAQREYHQSREISYGPDGVRAGLIAALSSESKP